MTFPLKAASEEPGATGATCFLFFSTGAGTLVGQMMRRALTNKVVLRVIALTLLALIIIILVAKYAPRSGHSDH